jgi:hypothetical protein
MNSSDMGKCQFGKTGCQHEFAHRNLHNYTCVNLLIIAFISNDSLWFKDDTLNPCPQILEKGQ